MLYSQEDWTLVLKFGLQMQNKVYLLTVKADYFFFPNSAVDREHVKSLT